MKDIIEKIQALPDGGVITEAKFGAPWRELQHPILTDELLTLVTLIEQQSAVIEEAEKVLERYSDECDTCGFDAEMHETHLGNPSVCDEFTNIAASALSRIRQLKGETK